MCSELLRIPYELGGVPLFGFGVLLGVWGIAAILVLATMVRTHGWGPETLSYVPPLALLGAAILLLPKFFPEGLPIRGYGVMLLAGSAAGIGLAIYRARQVGLRSETILSLAMAMFICGIVGARAFYVIEYWERIARGRDWLGTIVEILRFTEGGLVVYGALVGAAVAFVWFVRKEGLPLLAMADLVAPSLAIGLALGRVGCFLNGCCYGGETDLSWAVTFPQLSSRFEIGKAEPRLSPPYADQAARGEMHGFRLGRSERGELVVTKVWEESAAADAGLSPGTVIRELQGRGGLTLEQAEQLIFDAFLGAAPLRMRTDDGEMVAIPPPERPQRSRPVHPAQLYSAIDAGILAWFLWSSFPFRRRDGEVIALLLTLHPISRFLLEIIRIDESAVFGTGLSISQNISIALFVGAIALWGYLARRPRGVTWPSAVA